MTSRLLRIGMAILVGVLVVPGLAQARGRGHGKTKVRVVTQSRYYAPQRSRVVVYGAVRFNGYDRDDYYGDYGRYVGGYYTQYNDPYNYPPDWHHGRKVGWRGCNLPPGLAKKYGCGAYYYNGNYYRPNGTIISVTFATGR